MSGTDRKPGGRTPSEAHERTAQGPLDGAGRGHAPESSAPAAVFGDADLRAEARFMGRMLAAAVKGAGSARMAALVVRELAACGIGVGTSRHGPGDVLPLRREGSEAVPPGFAVLHAFERYRREIAALLRHGRCPYCAGSLANHTAIPGLVCTLPEGVRAHTKCAVEAELDRVMRIARPCRSGRIASNGNRL